MGVWFSSLLVHLVRKNKPTVALWVHHLILAKIFLEKNQSILEFLIWMIRVRFPSCHVFVIQVFSNSLYCSQVDTQILKYSYWCFWHICHVIQHAISKFLAEWIASLCCFPHSAKLIRICCTVDKAWNKVHTQN